ncbi:FKBP-type peptidyl-prolyl cis-trans isomerase [bacterium]|jgi:peptidylprolyl isomerase|nr:FKBP-type peptidyl-prolyl cis-trans isomerase [bacterium]|tara:strand:+ start:1684 stop:2118 length:435 start_codon:yes stop_codon:yes gene_type:complete
MTKLKTGDKVKVHYVGTLKEGQVFDSSREKNQPIEFSIDDGKLLKGFNDAVKGLDVGGKKTISLTSEEAYGKYINEAVITVPKSEFPEGMKYELNGFIQGQDNEGRPVQGQVVKIEEGSVNLDMNHPLAGEDLKFEIELVEVVK